MDYKEYSDKEIARAFTAYMIKLIKHSAIDYVRKTRRSQDKEISFSEVFNNEVSLSSFVDDGTFYLFESTIEEKFEKGLSKLSKTEQKLVRLLKAKSSLTEISKIMNIDIESVYSLKSRTKKKFKKYMEEDDYDE